MYSQIINFLQEDQFSKPWLELMKFIISIINENPQYILIPGRIGRPMTAKRKPGGFRCALTLF